MCEKCDAAPMARRTKLGRLAIAWGPDSHEAELLRAHYDAFTDGPFGGLAVFIGFHMNADSDPDPFASAFFGSVSKALVAGTPVVLTDGVFDDPQRRRHVERAFRRVFPELVIEHVELGGGPALAAADEANTGIVIDDDVYREGDFGSSNETIVVESGAPLDDVLAALSNAANRMMSVGEDGQDHDVDGALSGTAIEVYTPNYVSDVTVNDDGEPGFYIDCKGAIEPPMADRFRQILAEELSRRGVHSAHVRVPD
jgi:hypothetical protein